jgi:hypothetical protein
VPKGTPEVLEHWECGRSGRLKDRLVGYVGERQGFVGDRSHLSAYVDLRRQAFYFDVAMRVRAPP